MKRSRCVCVEGDDDEGGERERGEEEEEGKRMDVFFCSKRILRDMRFTSISYLVVVVVLSFSCYTE